MNVTGWCSLSGKIPGRGPSPGDAKDDEVARLLALESFDILDTPPEESFDGLTALAAYVCDVPMALIGFLDAERQWLKSRQAVGHSEIARELSFCASTMGDGDTLIEIPDTRLDSRLAGHPMVTGDPHLRFYAGMPIRTAEGHALGTICVMDVEPRTLSDAQRSHLRTLADQVMNLLDLRRRARQYAVEMTRRLEIDEALRQQQRLLSGVLDHTDVLVYAKDVEGRFVMANNAVQHVTQADRSMIGATDYDFFDATVADSYRRNDRRIMETREWQVFSEDVVHPDGSVHTYRSTKFPLISDSGEVLGVGGLSTDVTELAAARAAHEAAEERWRALVEQSPAPVIVVDAEGALAYVNPEGLALLGVARGADVSLLPAEDFIPPQMRRATQKLLDETMAGTRVVRGERGVLRRRDGTEITVEINATVVSHSGERSVQLEIRDVSEVAAAHAALEHSASTDPLTGVLNRKAWDARVATLLPEVSDTSPMTIAVIDLDNFKTYNDTRGHTAGDALLQQFAGAAAACLGADDVFARWGGEEFIVALPGADPDRAEPILDRLRGHVPSEQTCSIGYTGHVPPEALTDTVIRADKALYQAKRRGKNRIARL